MRTARRRLCDGRRTVGKREGGAEAEPFALNNLHLNEGTARQASGMAGRHAGRQACRQANLLQNLHDTSQSVRKSLRERMYL